MPPHVRIIPVGYLPDKANRATLVAFPQSGNLFSKGLPEAAPNQADQPPYPEAHDDLAAVDRHVHHRPTVIPVHLRV